MLALVMASGWTPVQPRLVRLRHSVARVCLAMMKMMKDVDRVVRLLLQLFRLPRLPVPLVCPLYLRARRVTEPERL